MGAITLSAAADIHQQRQTPPPHPRSMQRVKVRAFGRLKTPHQARSLQRVELFLI